MLRHFYFYEVRKVKNKGGEDGDVKKIILSYEEKGKGEVIHADKIKALETEKRDVSNKRINCKGKTVKTEIWSKAL